VPTAGDNERRANSQQRRCVAEGPQSTPPATDAEKGSNGRQPVIATRRDRQNRKFSTLRTKPFRSSEGRQTWQKRLDSPYDPKSEDCATKSPSVPELGEVENLGAPSPTRKPKVDRSRTGAKRKGPAAVVNSRNLKPIGRTVSKIRGFENLPPIEVGHSQQRQSADTLGIETPSRLRGSVSRKR
jgi:hypothetical protein